MVSGMPKPSQPDYFRITKTCQPKSTSNTNRCSAQTPLSGPMHPPLSCKDYCFALYFTAMSFLSIASAAENYLPKVVLPPRRNPQVVSGWEKIYTSDCFAPAWNKASISQLLRTGWEASLAILNAGSPSAQSCFLVSSQECLLWTHIHPEPPPILPLRLCFHRTSFMTVLAARHLPNLSPHLPDECMTRPRYRRS